MTSLENNEEELATLDKILNEYVGGAGKYQLFNTIVMAWVYYAGLYALFVTNFAAYEPPHRCRVDQCDELEFANQSTVGIFSIFFFSDNNLAFFFAILFIKCQ